MPSAQKGIDKGMKLTRFWKRCIVGWKYTWAQKPTRKLVRTYFPHSDFRLISDNIISTFLLLEARRVKRSPLATRTPQTIWFNYSWEYNCAARYGVIALDVALVCWVLPGVAWGPQVNWMVLFIRYGLICGMRISNSRQYGKWKQELRNEVENRIQDWCWVHSAGVCRTDHVSRA